MFGMVPIRRRIKKMDTDVNFFYALVDGLQEDKCFKIRQLLFKPNGQEVIKVSYGKKRKMRLYKIIYDQNLLMVTIKRSWLIYDKLIATIKINIENEYAVQVSARNVRSVLLK